MLIKSFVSPGRPEIYHHFDLSEEERKQRFGTGSVSCPGTLTAGSHTTVQFDFTIGLEEIETGGMLVVCWRWPFDWGNLQMDDPGGEGHVSIAGPAGVTFAPKYYWIGGVDPWHHHLRVPVSAGRLQTGDQVRITCGAHAGTHPGARRGWRVPTSQAKTSTFMLCVDGQGKGNWHRLPDAPGFTIVAGPPEKLLAVAPSDVIADETFEVAVHAEDHWGNPALLGDYLPEVKFEATPALAIEQVATRHDPIHRIQLALEEPGAVQLQVEVPGLQLSTLTNPIRVHASEPLWKIYWGDLHSGQTFIGCGSGTLAEHYAFARDIAGVQVITHQANDHYVTRAEWSETREVTDAFYEPGKYVPILGCEWSPLTCDGGDRNVFYKQDEPRLRRSSRFFLESEPDPEPDVLRAPEFLEAMRDQEVLINMHVGGRPTNLDWHEPRIEQLAEIHSTHGTSEWFIFDALNRGYVFGITAGTDGVMGRPGACHPGERLIRNLRNGLTGIYATELTREAIWDALQRRCTYATTGPRIRLWFEVDGQPMGQEHATTESPRMKIQVEGTAAIERIDILRATTVIHSFAVAKPRTDLLRILWGGTERKGTARMQTVNWDGTLSVEPGDVQAIQMLGCHSPRDRVVNGGIGKLTWSSKTAGNAAGVIVRVDPGATATFVTEPITCTFRVADALREPITRDAGGVGRFISFGPAPAEDGPRSVRLEFEDLEPRTGHCPYWIRVTQVDQERAWSSPVYVARS